MARRAAPSTIWCSSTYKSRFYRTDGGQEPAESAGIRGLPDTTPPVVFAVPQPIPPRAGSEVHLGIGVVDVVHQLAGTVRTVIRELDDSAHSLALVTSSRRSTSSPAASTG